MPSDTTTIQDAAARLPHRERARLALRLIESLDPDKDEDVSEIWLAEAERRLKAYDEGTIEARDIDDALSEIEQRLK
jgi:putative addiction module component (TIGR02574 family)